uniref:Phospholipid scramblase n=1 Tax=Heterorhabditis bacteriophora TaxID=37862 RepID=A0A1I7XB98_HETBA
MRIFYFTIVVRSIRVFNPDLNERITHYLVESEVYSNLHEKSGVSSSFLTLCSTGHLTQPFPQFLCPLMFLVSKEENSGVKKKHPCSHLTEACLLVFLPYDRILMACTNLSKSSDTIQKQDFLYDFVVEHNFSKAPLCEFDSNGRELCSLDSIFVDGYLLMEEHNCCCRSGYCAIVLFDQLGTTTPFVRMIIDLNDIINRKKYQKSRRVVDRTKISEALALSFDPFTSGSNIHLSFRNILLLLTYYLSP